MSKEATPPTEQVALERLADLVLVRLDQRAEPAERYEQLRQAWKTYVDAPEDKETTP